MTQPIQNKYWHIAPRITPEAERELDRYPPYLRQILFNRGYATAELAEEYLRGESPKGTQPFGLKGMQAAVHRVQSALERGQSIVIYGDYDADGVTATALLVTYLHGLDANVRGYIPNRFDEGYGLNNEALEILRAEGADLVITVDCGIRSPEEIAHASNLGLDIIVTDHHHPGTELPDAVAIINPKQPGDEYPHKDLAGVGLAFKLTQALDSSLEGSRPVRASDFLDLVALGTVADLAPLVGENRALVRAGIYAMHRPQRQGVLALMGAAGINPAKLNARDIGYGLGPRLNAAGRLDTALSALELLTTNEIHTAGRLAQELEVQNQERQKITREIQARAEEIALAEDPQALIIFAVHEDFNPGVVGLAASRLAEAFYRPAVVAHAGDEFTRASCRSIPEFHITEALDQCADLLEHHGGHAAAAGFTVRNQNLPELERRLRAIAQEQLRDLDLRPSLYADMEIPLHELKPEILRSLENMQPTGYGNRQAYFVSRRLRPTRYRTVGRDKSHLKLSVSDHRITYDAIAFRQGYWAENMPDYIDVFYAFEENEYNGRVNLQLNVRDIKPSGED